MSGLYLRLAIVALALLAPTWKASGKDRSCLSKSSHDRRSCHTPSADLDRRSSDLEELAIRGGFTWGAQAARLFGPNWAAEVMRTEHSSALQIGTRHRAVLIFFHGRAARHGPALRA
jgi:hypothetical protein